MTSQFPVHEPRLADGGRFAPGTRLAGRYRIVALLGRGGMGEVYRAEDFKLGESVALKLLPKKLERSSKALVRLRDEVKVARRITHPNICRVYDLADDEGLHFITMEYLPGEDLKTQLKRLGRPSLPKAIGMAVELCAALSAMHDRNVLHRDIKPSNLMLDENGALRLMDFGLAGIAGSEGRGGSWPYLAPELWNEAKPTVATDLYAAGLVLYELFTGHPPFRSESIQELAWMHGQTTPAPPSQLIDRIAPRHDRIILRCLEKNPTDRPSSAEEVGAAFTVTETDSGLPASENPGASIVKQQAGLAMVDTISGPARSEQVTKTFEAFLSHDSADRPIAKELGHWLEDEAGFRVWLDEWNLIPGAPWQKEIEEALDSSKCCVVFFGASGLGAWQDEEMRAALAERVADGELRMVPVLLPGADRPKESDLPAFLRHLTWVRFGEDWKDEEALYRLRCGIQGIPPGRRKGGDTKVCPYRGLEVFRRQDQRFFFGRDALVERLLDFLGGHRFVAVMGPSGSGKSSVVQAGLIPKLDDGETLIELLTPQERPLEELAFALRRCFPDGQAPPTEELLDRLRKSGKALHLIARELAEAAGAKRVFLVIDQFEELFTQTSDEEQRRRFVTNLLGAVESSGPTSVILTMRSDFLGRCAFDPDLNVFVEEHLFQVGPMSRDEQESAIVDPARLVDLAFEEGLVDEILSDVSGSPGELPLIQHALLELYNQREGGRLTLRTYQRIGRIGGALTRRAEAEFEKLDVVGKETLRKMFVLCLVKAGAGTEDTRRRASRKELLAVGEDPRIADSLLEHWTHARLLTAHSDEVRHIDLVDVAHEALIRRWGRLATWMAEGREEARLVDVLRQGAHEWQQHGHRPDYLFHGARLAQMKELLASHGKDLTSLERSFVAAASARALRRLLLIAAGMALALAIAGYVTYDSRQSKNAAERRLALNYWAESQTARSQGRRLLSLHLIAEATALVPDSTLRDTLLIDVEQFQPQFASSRVLEHQGLVEGAVFNSDESRVLTWSRDNTARLWDAASGEPIGLVLKHQDWVLGAVFNGDESRVLTWSKDKTARLWDAATGEPVGPTLQHQDAVMGAVFDGDESRVLTWSKDKTARLWNASTGEPVTLQHLDAVTGAVLSGDESRVLTWSKDNTAQLWDAATGEPIEPALKHQAAVTGAVFNGDESRVLTWSNDSTARLWDTATGEPIGPALKHQSWVVGAVLNGDESRVLTWSFDTSARLWDAATGEPIGPALKHEDTVLGAVFNEDESRVLTWSRDHTARLWDAATGEPIGPALKHQDVVTGAVFNGDESRVLTWSFDSTARLWDAATGEPLGPALNHQGWVKGAVFNGDGSRVLTWSRDHTARLWDAATSAPTNSALQHQEVVLGAVFNGDGSRVLTWSRDNTARLWDTATGEPIGPALQHQDTVRGAIFNGDESRVLTWSYDNTARLWDATTGEPIGPALQHQDSVWGAIFNGDGSRVLTWSNDAARLWHAATGEPIGPALQHQGWVFGARFNGDGSRVLTWSQDSTARLWHVATGEPIGPALQHRNSVQGAMFNGDESRVLTWSDDSTARLWEAATGEPIGPALQHQDVVGGGIFNGDGSRVLTWSQDSTARLWEAATGEPIGPALQHQDAVTGAVLNGDESRVLTWSSDSTARLWDAATGEPIGPALKHEDAISGAVFNGDESRVLTWSGDNTARLWEVGADFDLPRDIVRLQARAITGTEFMPLARETRSMEPGRWRNAKREWERMGRSHYKVCRYPRYNLWRRFRMEEAEGSHSLK